MRTNGRRLKVDRRSRLTTGVRRASLLAEVLVACCLPAGVVASVATQAASAATTSVITFSGHGWGHGRGAGQWGTLGYALQGGLNANQILAHYYSNTQFGTVANPSIRVILTANSGSDIILTSSSPFSIAGFAFGANAQARMHLNSDGTWAIDYSSDTNGCATNPNWVLVADVGASSAIASPNTTTFSSESYSNALALCGGSTPYYYRGQISGANYQGSPRTLNVVDEEDYLRGVVASESPAYWGTLGAVVATNSSAGNQPSGFFSLMVQAVEARSYALSSMGEFGFADICDSDYCQVYRGMQGENPISDLAISATAGEVLTLNGAIARTEFSSSTGGYSAGGTFPAAADAYDGVCVSYACNSNHDWSTGLTISQLQGDFSSVGTLSSITVNQRNGYGDLGGRILSITVGGSNGSVSLSGSQFAWDTGLNSNWFTFSGSGLVLNPNAASPSIVGGYYVDSSTGDVMAVGSAGFYGSMAGQSLNKPIVGMAETPGAAGYWLVASDGGIFSFGNASFYGSTGNIVLNKPIVGMASTPDGKGYWLVASDGGIFSFGDATFQGSMPGVGDTGTAVSMTPAVGVVGYYILTAQGNVYAFGQAPVVASGNPSVSGFSGNLVGIAAIPVPTAAG